MSGDGVRAAEELEALRQLKARYCRFLDTKDVESWRDVFTTDVVVTLDMAVSTAGADPMTAAPLRGVDKMSGDFFADAPESMTHGD
jgi:SnoaL-like domain